MGKLKWETIIFMVVVHLLGLVALLPQFWSWGSVTVFLILYWVTACLGVTIGYHRLLSHRSFKVPKWLERFFATCGALSAEYGPINWVGIHRQHHKYSDTEKDPHNIHQGFWHSHLTWMFSVSEAEKRAYEFAKDLQRDSYYLWLDNWFLVLQVSLGLLLYILGGWSYVLWGIFLRLAVVYQVTWLVNSLAHTSGDRAYDTPDNSHNNKLVAMLTFGEGWHNNHHMFPKSARHGLLPGQVDITWYHILVMQRLGLAKAVLLK